MKAEVPNITKELTIKKLPLLDLAFLDLDLLDLDFLSIWKPSPESKTIAVTSKTQPHPNQPDRNEYNRSHVTCN